MERVLQDFETSNFCPSIFSVGVLHSYEIKWVLIFSSSVLVLHKMVVVEWDRNLFWPNFLEDPCCRICCRRRKLASYSLFLLLVLWLFANYFSESSACTILLLPFFFLVCLVLGDQDQRHQEGQGGQGGGKLTFLSFSQPKKAKKYCVLYLPNC